MSDSPGEHRVLEIINDEVDNKPSRDGDDEPDDSVLNRIGSFFLVLGGESHETHLKGSVDNGNNRHCSSKSEDDIGCSFDNPGNITERNISFSEFFGRYTSSTEYPRIRIGSENMFRKERGSERNKNIERIFHNWSLKRRISSLIVLIFLDDTNFFILF